MPMPDKAPDKQLTEADISRVIEMAWEDRTPFEAIAIPIWFDRAAGDQSHANQHFRWRVQALARAGDWSQDQACRATRNGRFSASIQYAQQGQPLSPVGANLTFEYCP